VKAKDVVLLPLGLVYVAMVVLDRDRRARVAALVLLGGVVSAAVVLLALRGAP